MLQHSATWQIDDYYPHGKAILTRKKEQENKTPLNRGTAATPFMSLS